MKLGGAWFFFLPPFDWLRLFVFLFGVYILILINYLIGNCKFDPSPLRSFGLTSSSSSCLPSRDGNGYPKPEYPTGFTRYGGGYGRNFVPVGTLLGKISYPSGIRVRVW
jgi:hypothetical protein